MSRDHSLINTLFAWLNISSFQMSKIIPILVPYPIFFSARVAFLVPADTIFRHHSQTRLFLMARYCPQYGGWLMRKMRWAFSHRADHLPCTQKFRTKGVPFLGTRYMKG